jgi:hypothetical protein
MGAGTCDLIASIATERYMQTKAQTGARTASRWLALDGVPELGITLEYNLAPIRPRVLSLEN